MTRATVIGAAAAAGGLPPCDFATYDDMNRTVADSWDTAWVGQVVGDNSPDHTIRLNDSVSPTEAVMRLSRTGFGTGPFGPAIGPWYGQAEERIAGPGPWSTGDWALRTSVEVVNANLQTWDVYVGTASVSWGTTFPGSTTTMLQVSNNGMAAFAPMPRTVFEGMGLIDVELRSSGATVTATVVGVTVSCTNTNPPGPADDLVLVMAGLTPGGGAPGGAEARFGPIYIAAYDSPICSGPNHDTSFGADGHGAGWSRSSIQRTKIIVIWNDLGIPGATYDGPPPEFTYHVLGANQRAAAGLTRRNYAHSPFTSIAGLDYEEETRFYASHDAPEGATHGRLRCRIAGATLWDGLWAVPLKWELHQGTFGATDPVWDDIGPLLAAGEIVPDTVPGFMGDTDTVDVYVPVVSGRAQLVLSFGPQEFHNAEVPPAITVTALRRLALDPPDGSGSPPRATTQQFPTSSLYANDSIYMVAPDGGYPDYCIEWPTIGTDPSGEPCLEGIPAEPAGMLRGRTG